MDQYEILNELGCGAYGKVSHFKHKRTAQSFAIKVCKYNSDEEDHEGIPATCLREILILKQLDHPNVIKIHDVIIENRKVNIVMDLKKKTLWKYMKENAKEMQKWTFEQCRIFCYELLDGLVYLHKKHIAHRDFKSDNILLQENLDGTFSPIICDFGLGRFIAPSINKKVKDFENQYTEEVCTLWYRAPDVLMGCKYYNQKIDIWSAACVFFEVFSRCGGRHPLFESDSDIDQLFLTFRLMGTPTPQTWPELFDEKTQAKYYPHYPKNHCPKWTRKSIAYRFFQTKKFVSLEDQCTMCAAFLKPQEKDVSLEKTQEKRHIHQDVNGNDQIICNNCHLVCHLIQSMLTCNPEKRPTALQCMNHALFAEFNCEGAS